MMTATQGMPQYRTNAPPQYQLPQAQGSASGDPNTPSWESDISNLLNLAGNAYGLSNSINLGGAANQVFGQSNPFGQYRPGYGADLLSLMQNPGSVSSLPGYQFLLGQGVQAIDRSAAGPGGVGLGSGGEMTELMTYGQGLADQFYQHQVQTLSGLAGANIAPANPYQGLMGMGGAATSMGSSIAGLSNALPGTLNMLGRMFPQNPDTSDPSMGDPSGGYVPQQDPNIVGADMANLGGGSDFSGSGMDLTDMFLNPRTAGGEAAASGRPGGINIGAMTGNVLGIYEGLNRGGILGAAEAGIGATRLGVSTGAFGGAKGSANLYAGEAANLLGIYGGVKRGGVEGYSGAAVNAAQLGSRLGVLDSGIGTAAGYVAAPLALYEFAENWQSGATGSDALRGAEAGAAVGSSIVPGVGTAIGAVVGGALGAISSAFGPGMKDPENTTFEGYTHAFAKNPRSVAGATAPQTFQALAGLFDLRSGQIQGANVPMYSQYGRMGEDKFTTDMMKQINQSLSKGAVPHNASPEQIYSKVVVPWMNSWGKGSLSGSNSGAIQSMVTQLIGQWQSGQLNRSTPVGIDGQTLSGLPSYGS